MMFLKSAHNHWKKYSIFRILSEDSLPRDEIGSRMKVLKFILENEENFDNVTKGWIVNSFIDRNVRQEFIDLLISKGMYVVVVPWARKRYAEARNRNEKINAAIGINRARNLAIEHGHLISNFTFVLDGDCFFTNRQWQDITEKIEEDQRISQRRHYSVPCSRSTFEHALKSSEPLLLAEPMPVFRHDSEMKFDESIPFGQGDKLQFLFKLNHRREQGRHHEMVNDSLCKCFGLVHHLSGSQYEIEENQSLRTNLRDQSLDHLINRLDNFKPPIRKPNTYWQTIQGYFDFQGLYSHFAFDHPSGSRFVEVGSWLGASMCYLATEVKNREKNIEIFAVDTWRGSDEEAHRQEISKMGGEDVLFARFNAHLKNAGVDHLVKPLRMTSVEASKLFADESLDVVFIDASHKYKDVLEDLRHWYPKVKKGGKISGHDYVPSHKMSVSGVIKAVNEFFKNKNLEISPAGRTWLHHK